MFSISILMWASFGLVLGDPRGLTSDPLEQVPIQAVKPVPKDMWVVSNAGHADNADGLKCQTLIPHCARCAPGFKACVECQDLTSSGGSIWTLAQGKCVSALTFEEFTASLGGVCYSGFIFPSTYYGLAFTGFLGISIPTGVDWNSCSGQPAGTENPGYAYCLTPPGSALVTTTCETHKISSTDPAELFCLLQLSITMAMTTTAADSPVTVHFTGTKADGATVSQDILAYRDRATLAVFPPTFCFLQSVEIQTDYPCYSVGVGNTWFTLVVLDDIVLDTSGDSSSGARDIAADTPSSLGSDSAQQPCGSAMAPWAWALVGGACATMAFCGMALLAAAWFACVRSRPMEKDLVYAEVEPHRTATGFDAPASTGAATTPHVVIG